jgi:hypothetical protein
MADQFDYANVSNTLHVVLLCGPKGTQAVEITVGTQQIRMPTEDFIRFFTDPMMGAFDRVGGPFSSKLVGGI